MQVNGILSTTLDTTTTCHPCTLTDGITNEGLPFNSNDYVGSSTSLKLFFGFCLYPSSNHILNRIYIYYYSNPSLGYGLPHLWMFMKTF